jgi:hypothetical protein
MKATELIARLLEAPNATAEAQRLLKENQLNEAFFETAAAYLALVSHKPNKHTSALSSLQLPLLRAEPLLPICWPLPPNPHRALPTRSPPNPIGQAGAQHDGRSAA